MTEWQGLKGVIGLICAIIGLYHWLRLGRDEDAAYRAGNAVMFTIISYNLMEDN